MSVEVVEQPAKNTEQVKARTDIFHCACFERPFNTALFGSVKTEAIIGMSSLLGSQSVGKDQYQNGGSDLIAPASMNCNDVEITAD
jgi:hypothetical protein